MPTNRDGALRAFNANRSPANRSAAAALTAWSALNIVTGTAGWLTLRGERARRFHQANALFDVAILGSAFASFYAIRRQDLDALDSGESLRRGVVLERSLLLGIGLDVASGVAGGLLWRSGNEEGSPRLAGWGQGLTMQGALLLLFDAAVYLINAGYDRQLLSSPGPSGGGRARALRGRRDPMSPSSPARIRTLAHQCSIR